MELHAELPDVYSRAPHDAPWLRRSYHIAPGRAFFVTAKGRDGAANGIQARNTLVVDCSRTPVAGSIVAAANETLATSRSPPEPSVTAP